MKNLKNKYIFKIIFTSFFLVSVFLIQGVSHAEWDDLDEEKGSVYGLEKEIKYPVRAFFVEREKWENHSSFMFFWFYKTVDYPKYKSKRIFPLYYNLKSKIDNREKTLFLPFFL